MDKQTSRTPKQPQQKRERQERPQERSTEAGQQRGFQGWSSNH